MTTSLPRLMITAPGSGHGKTTVATGLMAAWRAEGLEVSGFKVGPDFIDPGYHALATGRVGRNLDPVLCGEDLLAPLLLHGAAVPGPSDVAVVEGVMGLFDGQLGTEGFGSTARVAALLRTPLVLVLDVSAASRTAAAIVHGVHTFDPDVRLAGVILNKVGSERHSAEVIDALQATGLPVLGALPRDAGIEVPSRHLGLVTAAEQPASADTVRRLGERVAAHLDLTALLALAHTAPPLDTTPWSPSATPSSRLSRETVELRQRHADAPRRSSTVSPGRRPVVAVAGGRAFTFRYAETDELLRAGGCEPVEFDPLTDQALPPGTAGLYLGGGFPEVHAAELSANAELRADIAGAVAAGLPTVAECAGLLYLCTAVDGLPMVGAIPGRATMTDRLTLGYRVGVAGHDSLLGPAGTRVSGHEFHRTVVTGLDPEQAGWLLSGPTSVGSAPRADGTASADLHASYLHVHWAGHPQLAARFAEAVHAFQDADRRWRPAPVEPMPTEPDLDHHGDAELAGGLVDLAVNVRVPAPPGWLADAIAATIDELAAYPHATAATLAIAAAHPQLSPRHVLPTAGAAEAFTLIARAISPHRAVVVHPQFTEPEAALRAAGHRVHRVVLSPEDGFRLDPELIGDDADLVVVGNPTNPTGVLHPRETIRALSRPGRVLVVDEAFMDAVPGEPETLLDGAPAGSDVGAPIAHQDVGGRRPPRGVRRRRPRSGRPPSRATAAVVGLDTSARGDRGDPHPESARAGGGVGSRTGLLAGPAGRRAGGGRVAGGR